jgi:hypothetical protein
MLKLTADHYRALEILAGHHNGCTEDELTLIGFTEDVIDELLRAGLATAETTRTGTKWRAVKVRRIGITGAGRRALK